MTLTDVATVVFLLSGVALLVTAEFERARGTLAARRALFALWLASGVGFTIEVASVIGPILRWILA